MQRIGIHIFRSLSSSMNWEASELFGDLSQCVELFLGSLCPVHDLSEQESVKSVRSLSCLVVWEEGVRSLNCLSSSHFVSSVGLYPWFWSLWVLWGLQPEFQMYGLQNTRSLKHLVVFPLVSYSEPFRCLCQKMGGLWGVHRSFPGSEFSKQGVSGLWDL